MKLLVLSSVSIPEAGRYLPDWSLLPMEFKVKFDHTDERPDAVVCMSVSRTSQAFDALRRWPGVPFFVYHWDCYSWIWTRPRPNEYDYDFYGRMLKQAHEIWVPSRCTALQAKQWWDVTCRVLRPSAPTWDAPNVKDGGYALCTLRRLPDECEGWFERACEELNLSYYRPNHALPYHRYQELVAGCRVVVSHYKEASTGGLTLLEAYHLGKKVLLTDSLWNGANEYFGDRAVHFPYDDYPVFRDTLGNVMQNSGYVAPDHREWVRENFSDERMLGEMLERLNANLG